MTFGGIFDDWANILFIPALEGGQDEAVIIKEQGPDTQKHLSPTYLSAVHVTAVKTTYFIESVYSKLRLS